ncbi:Fungal lipase-like domain-containing protein [Plasmodiophora brassicae]
MSERPGAPAAVVTHAARSSPTRVDAALDHYRIGRALLAMPVATRKRRRRPDRRPQLVATLPSASLLSQCIESCAGGAPLDHLVRSVKSGAGAQVSVLEWQPHLIIALQVDSRVAIGDATSTVVWDGELVPEFAQRLWESVHDDCGIASVVARWRKRNPAGDVVVTGHGYASCLAVLHARYLAEQGASVRTVLFGSPPVWEPSFAEAFTRRLPNTHRVVYERDALALSGPEGDRVHVGTLLHFRKSGRVCDDVWKIERTPMADHGDVELYRSSVRSWNGVIDNVRKRRRAVNAFQKLMADEPERDLLVDLAEISCLIYEAGDVVATRAGDLPSSQPFTMLDFMTSEEDAEVGVFRYGKDDLVIAYRGSSSVKDMYIDLATAPVPFDEVFEEDDEARVHQAFLTQFRSVRDRVDAVVQRHLETIRRVIVCGHSLGAANAILCALHLQDRFALGDRLIQVGYGCSRVGNDRFRRVYRAMVKNSYLIINDNDLVSGTLLKSEFRHVGRILHIRSGTNHLYDSVPDAWLPYSVSDHSIVRYIERLRQWSGRVLPSKATEAIIDDDTAEPYTPFEILSSFAD